MADGLIDFELYVQKSSGCTNLRTYIYTHLHRKDPTSV